VVAAFKLKAPAMMGDGTLVLRDRGTPQGGVISPLLANLFLHSCSMCGYTEPCAACRSNDTPTTSSVTAAVSTTP